MEKIELIYFQMISAVGTAKSMYIEAIQFAKMGDFEKAEECVEEGNEMFIEGHQAHAKLLQKEASGEKIEFSLLLIHAEDQFMVTDSFKILTLEFIDLYKRLEVGQ